MNDATLSIAPYRLGASPLALDLAPLWGAEGRIQDISLATKYQAKELFATFTRAYVHAAKLHALVKLHVAKAAIESRKRRSIVLLDEIPAKAKEKGLATSRSPTGAEDIREAFMYQDQEFLRIEEARASLDAAEHLVFGKLMAMKAAMDACSAMLSPDERPHLNNAEIVPGAYGIDTRGRIMEEEHPSPPPAASTPTTPAVPGFGKPTHS